MSRSLTLERQGQKNQAVILRKMGWKQQKIADEIGVPRRVVSYWLGKNKPSSIVAKRKVDGKNSMPSIVAKPTFQAWCGNVEEFSPEKDIKFDLIIADPPWNISKAKSEIPRYSRRTKIKKHFGFEDSCTDDIYLKKLEQWLKKLYEVANTPCWCWFWCSYRYISQITYLAEATGWNVHNWFAWVKTNPAPLLGANTFLHAIEPVLIMRKGKAQLRLGDGHLPNYFVSPQVHTSERIKDFGGNAINLAQKPVPLLSLIVNWCSEPGQWVLDAFAGSGSASLAALQNKRNCVAVELEQSQLTIIKGRLQKEGVI